MVLELSLIWFKLTVYLWPVPVILACSSTGTGHTHAVNLNKIKNYSKTIYDSLMKFSPHVNHKSVVNWWKNFCRSTTHTSATPLFVFKLWERLAPIRFEILQKKFFGEVLDQYQLPNDRNFKYLQKNGVLKFWNECSIQRKLNNPW